MSSERVATAATPATSPATLRPNAVGLGGVLFQSITLIGPGVAIVFGFGTGVIYAGGSFPLAIALAGVCCLLVAIGIGQLAVHLPSAGGFYTFITHGLGRSLGFLGGWLTIPAYLLFLPLNMIAFGYLGQGLSGAPWWAWGGALTLIMAVLTFFGVRLSVRTLVVLGTIEVGVFLLLSLLLVAHPADGNTLAAFTPASWPNGRGGVQGVLLATVIGFLTFTGFESAALLGEESRQPRRIIPRAIVLSVVLIGVFLVLASYAGLAGYGFNHIGTTSDPHSYLGDNAPSPWFTLAQRAFGHPGLYIIGLVLLNSLAANFAAGYTALSRLVYAMGRAGTLPSVFGTVSRRFRTPWVVILVAAILSVVIAVVEYSVYGAPPTSFLLIVDITGYCVLLAYLGVSLAVPFYYLRAHRDQFNPLLHAVIPAISAVLLLIVLGAQFFATLRPDNFPGLLPQILGAIIAGAWLLLGIVWLLVLRAVRPGALAAGERIYVESAAPSPASEPSRV
jgi:amino acid transporter